MGCLAGLLLLNACSSEENMADTGNKIDVAKGIRFQFTEEGFEPGEVAAAKQGTRALAEPQEIDLGNGIIAEATLEPDTAGCLQTRAGNPVPDGTYKIYAIDAGGTRHDGLTGTMTGGVFTPSGHWELEAGTYTFVCINSAVTDNGNELYVKLNHEDGMPLIGVSDPVTVTNPFDVFVSFVMRHQQARIRFQFVSYTEPIESPLIHWINCDQTFDVGSAYFDLKGNRLRNGGTNAGIFYPSGVLHLNQPYQPSSITKEYTYTTDYILCSPEFTNVTYYAIGGTLYGRTLWSNKSFLLGTFQKNHSYIWKLKFKNKDPWYLYNDGTIGSLAKRGSRTPIGIVVKEKTSESDQGTACALEDASLTAFWEDPAKTGLAAETQRNQTVYADLYSGQNDLNGYNWTWDANSTTDHVVRANEQEKYPAFYAAGHYRPSFTTVTGANVGKWYLPAIGEVLQLFKKFTPVNLSSSMGWSGIVSAIDKSKYRKLENAFTNVGNTIYLNSFFWTSTTADANDYHKYGPVAYNLMTSVYEPGTYVFMKNIHNIHVIPFVHF
ncbi:hypothetical protein SAMN02745202_00636 [Segatella oulorum]|uniref:Fimbrillin-like n=2 Tax=Segatella oulorum TaxID=28136 RepID=A0A1T4M5A1_9BACT|nr:hypothetical protein SAMN02745202_00636 [Segatella oulorum]